jgi:hypothetical protein
MPDNGSAGAADHFMQRNPRGARLAVAVQRLHRLVALALTLLATASACAFPDPVPAFRRSVFIDDRGISVPLPPPSFFDFPLQTVDVDGTTDGHDQIAAGTKLFVEDTDGDAYKQIDLGADATTFEVDGIAIDLTMNCLEVWMQAPDGRLSGRARFHVEIVDRTTIETVEGCE